MASQAKPSRSLPIRPSRSLADMLAERIRDYGRRLDEARLGGDLAAVQAIHLECDEFLRQQFPLAGQSQDDMMALQGAMRDLLEQYQLAIAAVSLARDDVESQLKSVGRARTHTNQYLNIARNLGL